MIHSTAFLIRRRLKALWRSRLCSPRMWFCPHAVIVCNQARDFVCERCEADFT